MKYEVDYDTLSIIRSFSSMCEYAMESKYEIVDFFTKLLSSNYFQNFQDDFTIFSQSPSYMLHKFIEELKKNNIKLKKMTKKQQEGIVYYKDASYWMGYVFLTWKIVDNLPKSYLLKYDIKNLVFDYDVLHTTSISYSIDMIKENYELKS